jgi:hypothetical protein
MIIKNISEIIYFLPDLSGATYKISPINGDPFFVIATASDHSIGPRLIALRKLNNSFNYLRFSIR